jgi:hypothetical protein
MTAWEFVGRWFLAFLQCGIGVVMLVQGIKAIWEMCRY